MPATWDARRLTAVAIGGVLGASLRWAVISSADTGLTAPIPWPVLAINVVGSVLLGMALAAERSHPDRRLVLHDGVGIGFCGGLTTFSTFSVEVAERLGDGRALAGVVYATVSVAAAIAGVVAGAALVGQRRARGLPLEEQP